SCRSAPPPPTTWYLVVHGRPGPIPLPGGEGDTAMTRVIEIRTPEEQERWGAGTLPPLDPLDLLRHVPDTHVILRGHDGGPVARCSLWWSRTPTLPGQRVGLVGHYAARGVGAARRLLAHACERLAAHACTLAVGPIDGSTWRRYRLIVERGTEPAFFLEPDNPDDWPAQFRAGGFTPTPNRSSETSWRMDPPELTTTVDSPTSQSSRIART
ncbi:MAG: hypothetical protein ACRELA_04650, partial [Candidatus Rokuibacteriota bacterium]